MERFGFVGEINQFTACNVTAMAIDIRKCQPKGSTKLGGMKRLLLACVASILFYSGVAWGEFLWSKPEKPRSWGPVDVVTTAQYYCYTLKEKGRDDWRLPTESELLNYAPGGLEGTFWSANFIPSKIRSQPTAMAVNLERKEHLYLDPRSKQLVICINDQFEKKYRLD